MTQSSSIDATVGSAEIRRLLFDAVRALPEAQEYFAARIGDEALLHVLIDLALADSADAVRLQAAYYLPQFSEAMLCHYEAELLLLQEDEWGAVAEHAMVALAKIRSRRGLAYLLSRRLAVALPWETKLLRDHLRDVLSE